MEPLDAADRRLTRSALLVGAAAGSALAAGEFPSRLLAGSAWPSASAYTAEVPLRWFELALELVRTTPVSARQWRPGPSDTRAWRCTRRSCQGCPGPKPCRSTERARPGTRPRGPRVPLADGREPGACLDPAEPVPHCGGGERGGDRRPRAALCLERAGGASSRRLQAFGRPAMLKIASTNRAAAAMEKNMIATSRGVTLRP